MFVLHVTGLRPRFRRGMRKCWSDALSAALVLCEGEMTARSF